MDFLSLHFSALLCGACFFTVYTVWRRSAARWSTWFPLVKKVVKGLLIGATVVLSFWAAGVLLGAGTHTGTAVLAFTLGLATPQLILMRKYANSKAEDASPLGGLSPAAAVVRKVRATKVPTHLLLGDVPVPVSSELDNFFVIGGTDTDKAAVLGGLLESLRARGDTVVVMDAGGALLAKHFKPDTDFIFNPFDNRCISWSPTAEVQEGADVLALARSIVPDGLDAASETTANAQALIAAVLRRLVESDRVKLQDLLYHVQVASKTELTALLAGTPAGRLLTDERAFGAAHALATAYLRAYDSLPQDQHPFSVAEMIRAEHSGVLFLTYRDDHLDSLRNLMACLMDVAARTVLSLSPDTERRIWLIVDDAAALGKVQSLELMATKAHKSGGCLVLGVNSVSQLVEQYGEHSAEMVLSGLGTQVVLRCTDTDTADYLSHVFIESEAKPPTTAKAGDKSALAPVETRKGLLSAQIQALGNLAGVLKLAGEYPLCSVSFSTPPQPEKVRAAFTARDFRFRPMLTLSAPPVAEPVSAAVPTSRGISGGQAGSRMSLPTPSQVEEPVAAGPISSAFGSARNVTKPVLSTLEPTDDALDSCHPASLPEEPRVREAKPVLAPKPEPKANPEPQSEMKPEMQPESKLEPKLEPQPEPPSPTVMPQTAGSDDKLADKPKKAPGQQEPRLAESKAPAIETLSSRRRGESPRSARKPSQPTPAPAPESRIPAAASSRGSARDLRSLLS